MQEGFKGKIIVMGENGVPKCSDAELLEALKDGLGCTNVRTNPKTGQVELHTDRFIIAIPQDGKFWVGWTEDDIRRSEIDVKDERAFEMNDVKGIADYGKWLARQYRLEKDKS